MTGRSRLSVATAAGFGLFFALYTFAIPAQLADTHINVPKETARNEAIGGSYSNSCLGILPGSNARLLRWPYLTAVSADSVTIQWAVPTSVTQSSLYFTAPDGTATELSLPLIYRHLFSRVSWCPLLVHA